MKKTIISIFLLSSILFASNNVIELTGKFAKDLGNPYRVLLGKKDKSISIFSDNKKVVLPVESNLDRNSIYGNQSEYPKTFILKNNSLVNVVKQFYGEEFNVIQEINNPDIKVNVLSGKVILDYMNMENNQQIHSLSKVEVELTVEIIKNDIKTVKTALLDDKLGIEGDNYNWTIKKSSFDLSFKTLNETIDRICENLIYRKILK